MGHPRRPSPGHPWSQGLARLRRDSTLRPVMRRVGPPTLRPHRDVYGSLIRSILSQQLSTQAADTIIRRVLQSYGGRYPTPRALARAAPARLRACGVSRQKAGYLKDLATRFIARPHTARSLQRLTDEEVILALTAIKGVGVWTAKMILIFTLGRPDVLPHEDLGIQLSARDLYGLKKLPDAATLTRLAEPWKPYRSLAAWYLWAARDQEK